MKTALSFASVACLLATSSQSVQAQAYWQANPNCAPVLSYSSAAGGPTATYYAGSQVRTAYTTCAPAAACAVAPTCAPPAPKFRSLVVNETISVPETVMEKRTVQEQQVRYEQRARTAAQLLQASLPSSDLRTEIAIQDRHGLRAGSASRQRQRDRNCQRR